jgi:glutamine---fructose-6-phosphate transaminase (isomerizing)
MTVPGQHTLREILSQPDAWRDTLKVIETQREQIHALFRDGRYETIFFTGCGSTYYLALSAATHLRQLGTVQAFALPASDIWLYPESMYKTAGRSLLVAVSRSGETTETIRACEAFQDRKLGDVMTLSCYPGRRLTQIGILNVLIPSGQEESYAQTRAFTSLYMATTAANALWMNRPDVVAEMAQLPERCGNLLSKYRDLARQIGTDATIDRIYFLGSGLRHGLTCELSMKMKEMSLSHCEPFQFMEFRHGPQSMITASTLIVGLLSSGNANPYECAVLDDMHGAQILSIGQEADVSFGGGLSEAACGVLYLPIGQLIAYERALSRGGNPDTSHNLAPVVRLTGTHNQGEDKS